MYDAVTTKIFALTSDICVATLSKEISEASPSLTCSDSEKTQLGTEASKLETAVAAIAKDLTNALKEMEGERGYASVQTIQFFLLQPWRGQLLQKRHRKIQLKLHSLQQSN